VFKLAPIVFLVIVEIRDMKRWTKAPFEAMRDDSELKRWPCLTLAASKRNKSLSPVCFEDCAVMAVRGTTCMQVVICLRQIIFCVRH